jgi:GNAT superfamily N-acetyltransferase
MLELRAVGYDHPDVAVLVAAVQREYVLRYGDEDATPVDPSEFAPPRGRFVAGYVAGEPVACGGWRARDAVVADGAPEPGADDSAGPADAGPAGGDAEFKRMFVVAGHRGRGYARAVLAELERSAAAAGRRRAVLETGTRQPEAMALYAGAGYVPIPPFGVYRDSPSCRCFAKPLPRTGGDDSRSVVAGSVAVAKYSPG